MRFVSGSERWRICSVLLALLTGVTSMEDTWGEPLPILLQATTHNPSRTLISLYTFRNESYSENRPFVSYDHNPNFNGSYTVNRMRSVLCHDYPTASAKVVIRCSHDCASAITPTWVYPSLPTYFNDDATRNIMMELSPSGDHLIWIREEGVNLHVTNIEKSASVRLLPAVRPMAIFTVDWLHGNIFCVYTHQKTVISHEHLNETTLFRNVLSEIVSGNSSHILGMALDTWNSALYWITQESLWKVTYNTSGTKSPQKLFVLKRQPIPKRPLAYWKQSIFWVTNKPENSPKIRTFRRYRDIITRDLRAYDAAIMSCLTVYDVAPSVGIDPCSKRNCSHICLPVHNDALCACSSGFTLARDDVTCVAQISLAFVMLNGNWRDVAENKEGVVKLLNWYESKFSSKDHTSLKNVSALRGLVPVYKDNSYCYFKSSGHTVDCVGDGQPKHEYQITTDLQITEQSRIAINIYNVTSFRLLVINENGCIFLHESLPPATWTLPCLHSVEVTNPILVDFEKWLLFWQSDNGSVYRSEIWSETHVLIANAPSGIRMSGDVENERVYWLTETSVNGVRYDGMDFQEFYLYNGEEVQLSDLICLEQKLYWFEHWETFDDIVIFDLNVGMKERLFHGAKGQSFRYLAIRLTESKSLSTACSESECSHFCAPLSPSGYRCTCPDEFPILFNDKLCTGLQILAAMSSTQAPANVKVEFVTMNHGNGSFPLRFQIADQRNAGSLFAVNVGFNETTCWVAAGEGLKCRLVTPHDKVEIIQLDEWQQDVSLLGIGSNGRDVYWSRRYSTYQCLSVMSLELRTSIFDIICNDVKNPVAIDSFRHILFWYNHNSLLYHQMANSTRHSFMRYDLEETNANCTSLAVDEFKGTLFLILGSSILALPYNALVFSAKKLQTVHQFTYDYAHSLHYHHDHLFWIGGTSHAGEFIEFKYIGSTPDSEKAKSFPASFAQRIKRSDSSSSTAFLEISLYEPITETHKWADPCSENICSHFCFTIDPLPPKEPHSEKCSCPLGMTLKGQVCVGDPLLHTEAPSTTQSPLMIVAVAGSILVIFIITTLIIKYMWRWAQGGYNTTTLTENELREFLQGNRALAEKLGEGPNKANVLPFHKVIPAEDIVVNYKRELGSGHFGVVYAGRYKKEDVAIKTMKPGITSGMLPDLLRELKNMAYIGDHDHVVDFIGAEIKEIRNGKVHIIMELSPQGSLEKYLRHHKIVRITSYQESCPVNHSTKASGLNLVEKTHQLLYSDLFSYVKQIALGMHFLETKNIVHGDLATRNILVFGDGHVVKISDFGLSRNLYKNPAYRKKGSCTLPFRWAALETLESTEFSPKSDVWSFGVTVWEIFSFGKTPFPNHVWNREFTKLLKDGTRLENPEYSTPEIYDKVMIPCWQLDPDQRPSFEDLEALLRLSNFPPKAATTWVAISASNSAGLSTTSSSYIQH